MKNFQKINNYKFDYVINLGGYVNHINRREVKNFNYEGVKNLYDYFKTKNLQLFVQLAARWNMENKPTLIRRC